VFDDHEVQEEVALQTCLERYEARLRDAYHQKMPQMAEGGRKILFVCPYCQHLWMSVGRHKAFVRLTDEQEWALVRDLRDGYHGEELAASICCMCATRVGGACKVEAMYRCDIGHLDLRLCGYRLVWEGIRPAGGHLICVVARSGSPAKAPVEDQIREVLSMNIDAPISHNVERELMAWVKGLSIPVDVTPYSKCVKSVQARLDPPGHGDATTALEWCGYSWIAHCPVLGGTSVISLAIALPKSTTCPPEVLLRCWSRLLPTFEAVL
jgi:hypothetical protein